MRTVPGHDAGEFEWLVFEQDGVIARQQALRLWSEAGLRTMVRSGRWAKAHRGIYVTHNGPVTASQRVWIGVLAAGRGRRAPLAGLSALAAYGLRNPRSSLVDVLIPAHSRDVDPPPYVRVHRTSRLTAVDYRRGLPPRTSVARSVVDAAQWAYSDNQARVIVAASFQQKLVTVNEMDDVIRRMPRARRRSLVIETVRDADGGSESTPELDFLRLCRSAGLPEPSRQTTRLDALGRRRYRDAYFEEWRVHVEIDGSQHIEPAEWWADMARQNALWIAGDRVLRFPAWTVRHRPAEVVDQIRAALTAAGWPAANPPSRDLGTNRPPNDGLIPRSRRRGVRWHGGEG